MQNIRTLTGLDFPSVVALYFAPMAVHSQSKRDAIRRVVDNRQAWAWRTAMWLALRPRGGWGEESP